MNQDRYIPNSFDDYDGSELLEDGHLIAKLHQYFISQISVMFQYWEGKFVFDKNDTSVYTGAAGSALLYLKLFEANIAGEIDVVNADLLNKAKILTNSCVKHLKNNRFTFLCGNTGTLTIKSIINALLGKDYKPFLKDIARIANNICQDTNIPDEVLFGRSGVLYSLLLIRSKLADSSDIIDDQLIQNFVNAILKSGQDNARREKSKIPLVFYWHDKAYIGAAHGYSGILYMLLEARKYLTEEQLNELVKPTINFVHGLQFSQSGNFRSSLSNSEDRLVHWCHGSPGVIHLLILAYQVFGDANYMNAALKSAEDIWLRGLLKKGFGICHGVSGNGYAFLRLFQSTNDKKYLYRAIKFAEWYCNQGKLQITRIPDRPFSLFEGLAGPILYLIDLLNPQNAKFPAFQI